MAGRRANYHWEVVPATVAQYTFAQTAVSTRSFLDLGAFQRSGTLRRMIVDVYVQLATGATGITTAGRTGLIIARPAAVTAGAGSVSSPISNGEVEWLWNRAYALKNEGAAGNFTPLHLHDDVRGMRKYKEDEHLIFVLENGPGAVVDSFCSVRFLEST